MGRGLKCACGIVKSPGGDESSQLLLLLALLFRAKLTGVPTEGKGSLVLLGWSELLNLERVHVALFFGLSAADFDLGRPTFGRDCSDAAALSIGFFAEGRTPSCASLLSRRAMGDGVPDRNPDAPYGCFMPRNAFQRGLELLKL